MQERMNHPEMAQRLDALRETMQGASRAVQNGPEYANNHIHTTYSFSPYSPALAAYKAYESGLTTAGIMDHDTVAGALEFVEASQIIGIGHTVGFELRCRMDGTPFEGLRINNPDQNSVAYLAMHGIAHQTLPEAQAFLTPYREARNMRNRAMVQRLNAVTAPLGIALDFDADIVPLSQAADGGSVTERHILYALARRLMDRFGRGEALLAALRDDLGLAIPAKIDQQLQSSDDPWYDYRLLGLLKAELVAKFYIDATDECPHVSDFIALSGRLHAIPAYAYLGDVQGSVTGDKKDQTFEDGYLDELVPWLAQAGFRAITFMPSRNTPQQLARIMALCDQYGLFQISGEDINSPFQSFICPQLAEPPYRHLVESTWALIGHEQAVTRAPQTGMFAPEVIRRMPTLAQRIKHFAALGRAPYAQKEERR